MASINEQTEGLGEPVEFISSSGQRVVIPHDPSPQACERFIRILTDIQIKNRIKNN